MNRGKYDDDDNDIKNKMSNPNRGHVRELTLALSNSPKR